MKSHEMVPVSFSMVKSGIISCNQLPIQEHWEYKFAYVGDECDDEISMMDLNDSWKMVFLHHISIFHIDEMSFMLICKMNLKQDYEAIHSNFARQLSCSNKSVS